VLGKVASIIGAFDGSEQIVTLQELSRRANLPKSTVHRLAEQLCRLRWVEREGAGYRIGIRLLEIGGLALQRNHLHEVALPHMYQLTARSRLAAQLGVLDRGDVVYLDRIFFGGYRPPTRLGARRPAYCTALGKAMLAFDESAAREVMASPMAKLTARTITSAEGLRRELGRVRTSGVAFDRGEALDGVVCVAAPIRNSGRAIGAVSVTGPVSHMDWETATLAVRQAAYAIWNDRFGPSRVAGPF
jgi:DNA-binding IclR family transcriptional regulator